MMSLDGGDGSDEGLSPPPLPCRRRLRRLGGGGRGLSGLGGRGRGLTGLLLLLGGRGRGVGLSHGSDLLGLLLGGGLRRKK